jgi:hypothetical protein
MKETIITTMVVAAAVAREIMDEDEADDTEEAISIEIILKQLTVSIVAKKVTIRQISPHPERIRMNFQTWYPKQISKIYF